MITIWFYVYRTYAKKLSEGVLQNLVDLLWEHMCLLFNALHPDLEKIVSSFKATNDTNDASSCSDQEQMEYDSMNKGRRVLIYFETIIRRLILHINM